MRSNLEKEKVSVIVVAYNSAKTIVQTLNSIKEQSYRNLELIVSDDCSKDNTVSVVSEWIEQNQAEFLYPIKLVTTLCNSGIPANINRGLEQAEGVYMKLIAADDYMLSDAISKYVDFCQKNSMCLPIAQVRLFSDEPVDLAAVQAYCDACYEFAESNAENQYRELLRKNRIVAPGASFLPMALLKKTNGYDETFSIMEDYPMHLRCMKEGYRFGLIREELVCYRISGASLTGAKMKQIKKTEKKLFFKKKCGVMLKKKMYREALAQTYYWLKH